MSFKTNSNDWPYSTWTSTKPTHEGLWWRRDVMAGRGLHASEEIVRVKEFRMKDGSKSLAYLDENCGWQEFDELSQWSSKEVARPGNPVKEPQTSK